MQLIWVASPTSKIRKFNITRKQIKRLSVIFALLFTLAGSSFYFLGFRLAIKIKPALAQTLGGVVTIEEQKEIEAEYRNKLDELHSHLTSVEQLVVDLQNEKERLAKISTPITVAPKISSLTGSGGPYLPNPKAESRKSSNLFDNLDEVISHSKKLESSLKKLGSQWIEQINILESLPTNTPINAPAHSNYGNRIDPINGRLAFHSGVDFPAPPGTKIYSAGDGRITKIDSDGGYGLFIEMKHALGTTSKYAHLSKALVKEGDVIHRGQEIGQTGNSGRSTGPHLHFEITEDRNFKNPEEFLISGRKKALGSPSNLD